MTSPTWHFISAALAIALCVVGTSSARAQLEFTEILFNATANPETPWEWVEVRNNSAGPLDLDGYVLDDDDQDPLFEANILSANGNTIVPAGGVAVLYNGEALDFAPDRFLDAWGAGINVIEQIAVDHPGMEVGSPGSVPVGMMTVAGDMNGDGAVNFGDLSPFTVALTDPSAYEAMFPDVDRVAACDVSGSGSCDFGDLSPFVDLLTGGEGSARGTAVPEPTGMMLLLLGVAALTTTARVRN